MKKNILIVTGTRADYGQFVPTIKAISKSNRLCPVLLVTGMHTLKNFGHTIKEIKKDDFPVGTIVKISEKDDMLQSLCKEILGIRTYCLKNPVDLILVLGDRDEMFAAAIVAGHLKIPLAHIAGGDITSPFVVDEAIRHSITKFSHLHFTTNKNSYKRVLRLGEEKWRVFNVGATALDDLSKKKFPSKKEIAAEFGLNPNTKWFLIVQHPTPLDATDLISQIRPLLKTVSKFNAEKIIIYPNSDTGSKIIINEIEKYRHRKDYHIFKNLPRDQYLGFFKNSDLLLGNSSSGITESSFFNLPTVNIGNRQGNRERGINVINCDYSSTNIKKAIQRATSDLFLKNCQKSRSIYGTGNSAKKIVKILEKKINQPDLFFKKNIFY